MINNWRWINDKRADMICEMQKHVSEEWIRWGGKTKKESEKCYKDIVLFIEKVTKEARKEGREEMKKECMKAIDQWDGGYPSNHSTGPKFCFTPEIKQAISSL